MDRFEIEDADIEIAKQFKKQLLEQNESKPEKSEKRKEFEEKQKLRTKLKKMKFKKRKEYLNKIDFDELNSDYSKIKKVKRRKFTEKDLDDQFELN